MEIMRDCCYNCKSADLAHEECTKYSEEGLPKELSLEKLACWRAIPVSREIIEYVEYELNQEFGATLRSIYDITGELGCSESYARQVLKKSRHEIYKRIKETYGKHSGWLREVKRQSKE